LPDAISQGETKKALCAKYGLEGVFPFDAQVPFDDRPRRDTGLLISKANEALIRGCAAIIANMTPFRGVSTDVGTAYEMGFARGLGLIVYGYSNVSNPFASRTLESLGSSARRDETGRWRDAADMEVEDFELLDNLMLEGGIHASGGTLVVVDAPESEVFTYLGGFEQCVQRVSTALHPGFNHPGESSTSS
jgi:nucleoside 2-deoxyribosyltransferase